jgi:hypothetical protein
MPVESSATIWFEPTEGRGPRVTGNAFGAQVKVRPQLDPSAIRAGFEGAPERRTTAGQ